MPVEEKRESDGDTSDSVEYPSGDETSVYERRILKLKRRRIREFQSEFNDGEVMKASELKPKPSPPSSPIKISRKIFKKRKHYSTPIIAFQPRKSARLSSESINYVGLDEDFEEPPVYRRKSVGRRRTSRTSEPRDVEFNPDVLAGTIAYNVSKKTYSQVAGTTCHQCRQKTLDLKSRCYSPYCRGIRGMFCGVCLMKRYGEDVAVVLRDPNWKCPPCRGICNCSICRRSHGKQPTGILFPNVVDKGYRSVTDYLAKLGDDKLDSDFEADDESEDKEKMNPPPNTKEQYKQVFVKLERLDLSFDEEGNLLRPFKGF